MNRLNRAAVVWAVSVAALIGLGGCSSGTASPVAEPATETPALPEAAPNDTDSSLQACLDIAGPFAEASAAMTSAASGSDPQSAVDAWTLLVDALGSIAASSPNAEVKAAASAAQADFAAVRDGMQRVYIDGDFSAAGELATASSKMQGSYTALLELCSG